MQSSGLSSSFFIAEVHYLTLRLSSISLSFDGNFSTLRTKAVVSSYTKVKYPLCSHALNTSPVLSLTILVNLTSDCETRLLSSGEPPNLSAGDTYLSENPTCYIICQGSNTPPSSANQRKYIVSESASSSSKSLS